MGSLVLRSRQRRIIERPRLLRALDGSEAQVRTIVASAGYGKTTLAEQWSACPGRRIGWFRARTSASDVAVIARGLIDAAAQIVPGAGRRLLERLAVTPDPDSDARLLAEMLAVDLAEWPEDAWIVVDDYQLAQASEAPEIFVETLVRNAQVRMLLVGRERPRWVSSRDVLYGDVLEIGRAELAMTVDEIEQMLGAGAGDRARGLLALADGWPAVVALSSAAGTQDAPPRAQLPDDLFDFFAAEVFRRLNEDVQDGLRRLAPLPLVDAEIACLVLGEEQALAVMTAAVEIGIMDVREGRWELHPLAASFMQGSSFRPDRPSEINDLPRVVAVYEARGDWDAASLLARMDPTNEAFMTVVRNGAEPLLSTGRLGTLEDWVQFARSSKFSSAPIRIMEAELCLRQGRSVTALTLLAEDLREPPADLVTAHRVYMTAARASHIVAREEDALDYFSRAEGAARTRDEQRAAMEGRLMCAATLEMTLAHDLLETLRSSVDASRPHELIRLADRTLSVGLRFGKNSVREAAYAYELLERTGDPFARLSYMCLLGWGLVLECGYSKALSVAEQGLREAEEYRLGVTLPYLHMVHAAALAGSRKNEPALQSVERAHLLALEVCDMTGVQSAYALKLRILCGGGSACEAVLLEPPEMTGAVPWALGEVAASRALVLATVGRIDEALDLASIALSASSGVETRVLCASTRAICALQRRTSDIGAKIDALVAEAYDANALDLLVCAYRGNPDLIASFMVRSSVRERAMYVLQRAGDQDLSTRFSDERPNSIDSLSPREKEVFRLLCDGMSNEEIARSLFLSRSTVKVHVHHIFDKLETRSRSALIIGAALGRYAASADADT